MKKKALDAKLKRFNDRAPKKIIVPPSPPKMRIQAIRDFLILAPEQPMRTSPTSMIVIPEVADDLLNPPSGIVLSVGEGLVEGGQIIPLKVRVGDRVFFPRHSGTLIRNHPDVEDCFALRENQIFGYLRPIREDEDPAFQMESAPGLTSVESPFQ